MEISTLYVLSILILAIITIIKNTSHEFFYLQCKINLKSKNGSLQIYIRNEKVTKLPNSLCNTCLFFYLYIM